MKQRLLTLLVLLMTAGAWAQEVTLLTTIVSTGGNASFKSGSKTFNNIATVTFSGNVSNDDNEAGWFSSAERTLTVTAAEGYTITRVKFYNDSGSAIDEEAPFEAILVIYNMDYIAKVNGTSIGNWGVNKIEVYGYAAPAVAVTGVTLPATATVTLGDAVALTATVAPADATDKKVKWTVTAGTDKVKLYTDADCKTEVGTEATDALTVYAKGLAAGEATVKVESNADATKTATCAVTAMHGTYAVAMKAGVTDGDQWTARAGGSGAFAAMPLKGVEGGTKPVELKYGGDLEVKRVTMRVVPTWKGDLSKLSANELESDGVTVLVKDGMTLTGTLAENYKITIADGATVTLDGLTIDGIHNDSYRWAGISCAGDATIILKDGSENTVKGFHQAYPGIHVPEGKTLTITGETDGSGKLTTSSNGSAAGIGGGMLVACGNIVIEGGTVTAQGGQKAAGIGGGYSAHCGNITITDGVTKVKAMKGPDAPCSIGKGNIASCGTVTIGGTTYYDGSAYQNDGDTYLAQAEIVYPITIVNLSTLAADTELKDGDVVTGTLNGSTKKYKITIAAGAEVTLDGATINGVDDENCEWAGITCAGSATIVLKDGTTNAVKGFHASYPGIHVPSGSTLTIKGGSEGTGKLTASSNGFGAGIGGGYEISCGDISIEGGDITATGGENAAGIGAGCKDSNPATCGNISIMGGTVTATGGMFSAGIGGGFKSTCGTITITDGVTKVTATKGDSAPYSIGAGNAGTCGTVTIGGTVYWQNNAAQNGGGTYLAKSPLTYIPPIDLSTLTGDLELQDGDVVTGTLDGSSQKYKISIAHAATVTLDRVTINGVDDSNCEWAGLNCTGNATIVLQGVNTVKGFDENYPGIYVPEGKSVIIDGSGTLNASSNGAACGIGGGYYLSCGDIEIQNGTINVWGAGSCAGIGGGKSASCGDIYIFGGTITAYGGPWAAGIGSGDEGSCSMIYITGGTITAQGGEYAAGIGSGNQASCGSISIGNSVTHVTATKGSGKNFGSIGAGRQGSCSGVNISDPSKVTQN